MENEELWIEVKTEGLPDFRYFGFHTDQTLEVRKEDGTEVEAIYNGWGEFRDKGTFLGSPTYCVTHFRYIKPESVESKLD